MKCFRVLLLSAVVLGCGKSSVETPTMQPTNQKAIKGPTEIDGEGRPEPDGPRFWVREAAFSPDNKFLLTAYDYDGRIEDRHRFPKTASLWEVGTGREIWSLKASDLNVIGFAFIPDGKQILITDDDGVKVLDAANGKLTRSFAKNKRPIRCVAVSPDGTLALTGDMGNATIGSELLLWDVDSGKPIQMLQSGNFGQVLFSQDGKLMLACGGTIEVWSVAKRELLVLLPVTDGWCGPIALAPDGTLAVAVKRLEPTTGSALLLWESTTGKVLRSVLKDDVINVVFTADGKGLLTCNPIGPQLALLDVATGAELWTVKPESIDCCTFSTDGKLAFTSAGKFMDEAELRKYLTIWDAVNGKRVRSLGDKDP